MTSTLPADLGHTVGSDLVVGPSGDLQTVTSVMRSQQRVLRRLLTPQGDYIWNLVYGGSLPQMVGQPVVASAIEAITRQQMRLEASVAQSPPPQISVQGNPDGSVVLNISYTETDTGQTQVLTVPLG